MRNEAVGEDDRSILRTWGEVIRRYRHWRRLSRRELAQRAGLSAVFLGEIERGEKDPSSHSLRLVAEALDVPIAELYLRVAARLERSPRRGGDRDQSFLPRVVREEEDEYLGAVPPDQDETAFEMYKIVRRLRTDQQVSLLILVQALLPAEPE